MTFRNNFIIFLLFTIFTGLSAQGVVVEGYVFEGDNRGYLNQVTIEVTDANGASITVAHSNREGFFSFDVPQGISFHVAAKKDLFFPVETDHNTADADASGKLYLSIEMKREPGYIFDVTLAEERDSINQQAKAIKGADIEIWNNTTEELEMMLEDYPHPNFQFTFKKGNHYTVLIRKEGYFSKRLEAFVNVGGCILCFDGVGKVEPGVTDNLTEGHQMGTLLANVEMIKLEVGKKIELRNIYYDYDKSHIRPDAAEELDKLITLMKDNPGIIIELGSHTDCTGDANYNMTLSQVRATSAVNYLLYNGDIEKYRITAMGYGESQPIAKCKSCAQCTDEDNARNRRTELKVTGILNLNPEDIKTLTQIKEQEKFKKMLEELDNTEQVRITEDNATSNPISEEQDEKEEAQEVLNDEEIEEPIFMDQPVEEGYDQPVVFKPQVFEFNLLEVTPSSVPLAEILSVPTGFSGGMIQITKTDEALPPDHFIFKSHGKVYLEKLPGGAFSYMLGTFNSKVAAETFISKFLITKYPYAKAIAYEMGKRPL